MARYELTEFEWKVIQPLLRLSRLALMVRSASRDPHQLGGSGE